MILSYRRLGRQDPQLYEMRLQHIREMAKLQFEMERLETEEKLEAIKGESERRQREMAARIEYEEWLSLQKRALIEVLPFNLFCF